MKVLVDSNVIIDVLIKRANFWLDSLNAIDKMMDEGNICYVSASAITDIYYVLRKQNGNKKALEQINNLLKIVDIAEVNDECIYDAVVSGISDFEDAVIASTAKHIKASLIITRNVKDFKGSEVKVLSPTEVLKA